MSDFSNKRSFGLDIVRSAAIFMVLISHARHVLVEPDSALALTFGGGFGVELFFALSGFLIGTILIKLFDTGLTPLSLGRFWFRRWMRTLPAYYFILLFFWVVFGRVQLSDFVLLQWPINQNQGIVPVSWSLSIEEWFYILFPMGALLATLAFRKNGILAATLVAIVVPLIVRVYQFDAGSTPIAIRINPFRFDSMAFGVLAAYLMMNERTNHLIRKHWGIIAVTTALLFAFEFLRYNGQRLGVPLPLRLTPWFGNTFVYSIIGICCALIVVTFYVRSPAGNGMLSRLVIYVSTISYSLYLWHQLIFNYMAKGLPEFRGPALYVAVIVVSIIVAYVPYRLIEVPFMQLRDRLTTNQGRKNVPAPAL